MLQEIGCAVEWPRVMSVLKDLCTTGAALFATYIGWRGLTAWERQAAGQEDHELARRLLVLAYRYRDAIKLVRNPVMFGDEMPPPPLDRAANMSPEQVSFFRLRGAYVARLKVGADVWDAIRPDLLEAEAVWGADMKRLFARMLELDNELRIYIQSQLIAQDPDAQTQTKESHLRLNRERRDVIYDVGTEDQPDTFESDIRSAVIGVEEQLRPRLIQRRIKAAKRSTFRKGHDAIVENSGG